MKKDSPNKFLGGIAGVVGRGMTGAGSSMDNYDLQEKLRSSVFGGAAFEAMRQSQAQQAAAGAATVPATVPEATINGGVDPILAGARVVPPGTIDPGNPFAGKTFKIEPASPMGMVDPELSSVGIDASQTFQPPMASNEMGGAKDLFGDKTRGMAETIYGSAAQRQASVKTPLGMSPLQGNAFIKAKIDAEKAGASTFEVDGKTYNVK